MQLCNLNQISKKNYYSTKYSHSLNNKHSKPLLSTFPILHLCVGPHFHNSYFLASIIHRQHGQILRKILQRLGLFHLIHLLEPLSTLVLHHQQKIGPLDQLGLLEVLEVDALSFVGLGFEVGKGEEQVFLGIVIGGFKGWSE